VPPSTSLRKCCQIWDCFAACIRDSGEGRVSKLLETQILDNPSPANYEELGELYKDLGQFEKAREAFQHAITGRGDSAYTFYSRAQSSLGLNDLAGAIPDLEHVVAADRKFDYYRAAGLLADAYARTDNWNARISFSRKSRRFRRLRRRYTTTRVS